MGDDEIDNVVIEVDLHGLTADGAESTVRGALLSVLRRRCQKNGDSDACGRSAFKFTTGLGKHSSSTGGSVLKMRLQSLFSCWRPESWNFASGAFSVVVTLSDEGFWSRVERGSSRVVRSSPKIKLVKQLARASDNHSSSSKCAANDIAAKSDFPELREEKVALPTRQSEANDLAAAIRQSKRDMKRAKRKKAKDDAMLIKALSESAADANSQNHLEQQLKEQEELQLALALSVSSLNTSQ